MLKEPFPEVQELRAAWSVPQAKMYGASQGVNTTSPRNLSPNIDLVNEIWSS
jgi:hypothetical protein